MQCRAIAFYVCLQSQSQLTLPASNPNASFFLQNSNMKCTIQLLALIIIFHVTTTLSRTLDHPSEAVETTLTTPSKQPQANADDELPVGKMRLLLEDALARASVRSARKQRGLRKYRGKKKRICLKRDRRNRCIRRAVLGWWHG